MKRPQGLFFLLLLSMPLLSNAAAIEPAVQKKFQIMAAFDDLPQGVRAQVIDMGFPKITKFLMRRYANSVRIQIPNFDADEHTFAMSPSNALLVVGPDTDPRTPREMIIVDLIEKKVLHHLVIPYLLDQILITPDGKKVVTLDVMHKISIWDLMSATKLHDLGRGGEAMALSCDGSTLVSVSDHDRKAKIWNVKNGQKIREISIAHPLSIANPGGRGSNMLNVAVNPNGSKIALEVISDVFIIDTATGEILHTINSAIFNENSRYVYGVQFNSDGTKLSAGITCHGKSLTFYRCTWDVMTGEEISRQDYGSHEIYRYGNKRREMKAHSTNIYDNETGAFLCSIDKQNWLQTHLLTDNWFVATAGDSEKIYAWDLNTLKRFNERLLGALESVSWRQVILLDQIRQAFNHNKKLLLKEDNQAESSKIKDFSLLPDPIKKIVQEYVALNVDK